MSALTGPSLVAAALLLLAGAQKVVDPSMTAGALRSLRLPSSPMLVRLGSLLELAIGAAAIAFGGALTWGLVAISYVAFAGFVVLALQQGTMLGSCGCFGREDTPPHWSHVLLNLGFAAVAAVAVGLDDPAPLVAMVDDPAVGAAVLVLSAGATVLAYAAYVLMPRTLSAGHGGRSST